MDLSLVPIEDLFQEIKNRTDHAVLGMCKIDEANIPIVHFFFSKKSWMNEAGLAAALANHVMNNYSGELETLQKINDERKEEE